MIAQPSGIHGGGRVGPLARHRPVLGQQAGEVGLAHRGGPFQDDRQVAQHPRQAPLPQEVAAGQVSNYPGQLPRAFSVKRNMKLLLLPLAAAACCCCGPE